VNHELYNLRNVHKVKWNNSCPQEAMMSKEAMDKVLAKKLWEKSEALVGLSPEEICM